MSDLSGKGPSPVYLRQFRVLSSDVDMSRSLRLSILFTLVQEAAIAHTIELGVPRQKTLDRGLLWVVTQYRARIYRLPQYDEDVRLVSWPGRTMHLFFPRYFRLEGLEGELLAEISSLWSLIEASSRRIVFPEDYEIEIPETVTGQESPLPGRVRREDTDHELSYSVPYSCVDLNGHMNNARYFDLAADLMPQDFQGRTPAELTAEYSGEARLSDALTLRFSGVDNTFYISGEKDKPVFRIKYRYE